MKDFCSDRHRAAFRDSQVQAGIREAQTAIQEARDEIAQTIGNLEQLDARLAGATQLLERGLRHGRRKPKAERPPVQPSAELSKALAHLALPDELLDGVRKLQGLPPYDSPANLCWNDGYFHRSLVGQFGEVAVQAAIKALEKK